MFWMTRSHTRPCIRSIICLSQNSKPDNSSCPPHGGLGQVLPVPLLIQVLFVWGESGEYFPSLDWYLVEAPAEAGLHGDGKGGLGGLVGKLRPLGGDHEAFVVGGGANLDFNVVENSLDQHREHCLSADSIKILVIFSIMFSSILLFRKFWNLVKLLKFGRNFEIWSKFWNLVKIVNFYVSRFCILRFFILRS